MAGPAAENEQRRFTRIPFDAKVGIVGPSGRSWAGRLLDISLNGALVSRPPGWSGECGDDAGLHIEFGSAMPAIAMQARVAHLGPERIGFECRHIELESMMHLRRLLELNLDESQPVERELGALVFLKTPPGPRSTD